MSPDTNLLEVEEVFRDAGSSVYLIPKPKLTIVIGMPAWRSALDRLHVAAREPLRAGSYAEFWVTRRSGGVVCWHVDDLNAVVESDTCNHLR